MRACLRAGLRGCLVGWLVGCLVAWLVGWLFGWLVDWLVGWLVEWLVGWLLVGVLVGWLVGWWLVGWWDSQGRAIHQQSEFSRYAPSSSFSCSSTSVSTFLRCALCVQTRVEYIQRDRQMHIRRVRNEFSRCCLPVGSGGPQKAGKVGSRAK